MKTNPSGFGILMKKVNRVPQIVDIVHILENFTKFCEKKPEIQDHFALLLSLDMQNRPEN